MQWRKGRGYPKEPAYKQREMEISYIVVILCINYSEDIEETVVLGKRVSQPSVIGRWLIPSRVRTASRFLTHSLTDLQSCSFWFVWSLAIVGMNFRKEEIPNFADLAARHVAHHY